MVIAACVSCLNEADIIGINLAHLRAQGVDLIFAVDGGSTDGTLDILEANEVEFLVDADEPFRQVAIMNGLIEWAGGRGADWIIPFDADEFVYVPGRQTIAEALTATSAKKLYMKTYGHRDWAHRFLLPKRLPKVAFRYQPGTTVTMGQHDCSLAGGVWGVLEIREWQFRSFDHYCTKVAERIRTLDHTLKAGEAQHYRDLIGKSREQLETEWAAFCAEPAMYDPIPC